MGLFSFVGKAIKGIGKVVGGVAKVAVGAAKLGLIPGGGLLGGIAGKLLAAKQPMSSTAVKMAMRSPQIMRGNSTQAGRSYSSMYGNRPPPAVLRLSPVMPGGAVATPSGIAPRSSAPPAAYSGGYGGPAKKKRRTAKKKATTKRRRTTRGRKLKFGSPAWRKKYMKKRRRAA